MKSGARTCISYATVLSLMASVSVPVLAAPPISRAEYQACQVQDEAAFRTAIQAITIQSLEGDLKTFDFAAVVGDEWRRGGLDAILDARVDVAIAEVRDETSWGSLLQSLADSKKAEELATAVADRVYRSDAVKAAIEQLAVNVGKEVGKRIELASQEAAGPALRCLQAYLGPRYGEQVAGIVSTGAGAEFGLKPSEGEAGISSGAVLSRTSGGITGAAILLVRRQLANMAQRVGQRLVGSVLSRLVSVVAGGVGVVLIAKDLWDLRHGVLPIIADEMKAATTKDNVRAELAKTIQEEIGTHVVEIGTKSADHVVAIWQEFRRAHDKALELAASNATFKTFLNGLKPEQLPRLDEVVSLLLPDEGESGILARLGNGTLSEAVIGLPPPAMVIARESRSVDVALKWNAVAGNDVGRVVDLEIHRRASPEDFTRASLQRLFAVDDALAITRLASVNRAARDVLFDLDSAELKGLARSLSSPELETLARYQSGLEQGARERVLRAVAVEPAKMQVLAPIRVRDAILASRDHAAAVGMMLRADRLLEPAAIVDDVALVWDGRVSPILLWEKHPAGVVMALICGLILLLMLRRLFATRRPAPASAG